MNYGAATLLHTEISLLQPVGRLFFLYPLDTEMSSQASILMLSVLACRVERSLYGGQQNLELVISNEM
jgi:hypothetical protein